MVHQTWIKNHFHYTKRWTMKVTIWHTNKHAKQKQQFYVFISRAYVSSPLSLIGCFTNVDVWFWKKVWGQGNLVLNLQSKKMKWMEKSFWVYSNLFSGRFVHFHIFGGLRASLVVASWPNIDCVVPGSSRVITAMRTPLMDLEVRKENFVILYIKYL